MILFSHDHLDVVSNLYGITTSLGPSDRRTPAPPTSRCPRSILKEAEYDTGLFPLLSKPCRAPGFEIAAAVLTRKMGTVLDISFGPGLAQSLAQDEVFSFPPNQGEPSISGNAIGKVENLCGKPKSIWL